MNFLKKKSEKMRKKMYIHIGAHKTGTSAIQKFLALNRDILKRRNYCYPGKVEVHHDIVQYFHQEKNSGRTIDNDLTINKYLDEINKSNCENSIISSEGFGKLTYEEILAFKNQIPKNFDIIIIYYVRRQDERLESGYNQIVREPKRRYSKKFNVDFVTSQCHQQLDYYRNLSPWREVFGHDNIVVRVYEKEQLPNGIFHDFLDTVGLEIDDNFSIPESKINRSLSWDLIEIIRLCNIHFKDDIKFHRKLVKNLERINQNYNDGKQSLISPQQRCDIIELYAESNERVACEYLGREDGRLFIAPLPDLDEPWEPYEGLTIEKFIPIFTQMLYYVDTKYQRRFQNFQRNKFRKENRGEKMSPSLNVIIKGRLLEIFGSR